MSSLKQKRRSFLFGLGGLASAKYRPKAWPRLRPQLHRDMYSAPPKANSSFIFATMARSLSRLAPPQALALGTQQVTVGAGITIYRHFQMDEAFYFMSPAGIDGFFRDTCNPPGVRPKELTREQINEMPANMRQNSDNHAW